MQLHIYILNVSILPHEDITIYERASKLTTASSHNFQKLGNQQTTPDIWIFKHIVQIITAQQAQGNSNTSRSSKIFHSRLGCASSRASSSQSTEDENCVFQKQKQRKYVNMHFVDFISVVVFRCRRWNIVYKSSIDYEMKYLFMLFWLYWQWLVVLDLSKANIMLLFYFYYNFHWSIWAHTQMGVFDCVICDRWYVRNVSFCPACANIETKK